MLTLLTDEAKKLMRGKVVVERKEQLIEIARDLFLEKGTEGVSMRKVAKESGISATAIYRHFKNKDDLLSHVVGEGRRIFASYLFQALEGDNPQQRLFLAGQKYLDFSFEHPQYYKIFFMSWDRLHPELHGRQEKDQTPPTWQFLLDRIQECMQEGSVSPDEDLFEIAMFVWSLCHGLAVHHVTGAIQEQIPLDTYRVQCSNVIQRCMKSILSNESKL